MAIFSYRAWPEAAPVTTLCRALIVPIFPCFTFEFSQFGHYVLTISLETTKEYVRTFFYQKVTSSEFIE